MRRLSRETLEARNAELERDLDTARAGLQCLSNGEVNWFASVTRREDRTRFQFGVAELTRAHGGLFLIKSRVRQGDGKWDRAYTAVRYLEDVQAEYQRCAYWNGEYILRALRLRDAAYTAESAAAVLAGIGT